MTLKELPLYIRVTIFLLMGYLVFEILVEAKGFLIPVCIAALFSFLLYPISEKLHSWRVPRILAIVISILIGIGCFALLIWFLTTQAMSFSDDLPMLQERINAKMDNVQSYIEDMTKMNEAKQKLWLKEQSQNFLAGGGAFVMGFFSATGNMLALIGLLPIYIFFFIFYKDKFSKFVLMTTPTAQHATILQVLTRMSRVTQKYLSGLLLDIAILSVLNTTGFLLLGIDHAILLGVVASILNLIPYIGVLIGSLFPITMALLTEDSIWTAVGAAGVCIFVQFFDNNFLTPKIVGSSVSVNPLATLMALIIGGLVWGVAGMMMFIPFLGMMKVVFDNVEKLKPLGYLIGEETRAPKKLTVKS